MVSAVSRIVLAVLCGLAAYQASSSLDLERRFESPWHYFVGAAIVLVGAAFGALVGAIIARTLRVRLRALERAADRRSASELIVGALGLVVGLLAAALAGIAVARLPIIGPYLLLPVVLVVAYIFSRVAARRHSDILRLIGIRPRAGTASNVRLVDTSAIIDGRLAVVVRTRFLPGTLVIPEFVLNELQLVADSNDPSKRRRGQRGLEIVEELKEIADGGFTVRRDDYPDVADVDQKLVRMAHDVGAAIITTDFNLNKVARIRGIEVLNINELANALRPAVLPGESLDVKIVREGREYDQGVGYLDDGTMVVVDGGRRALGDTVTVEVTSVLQNPSGQMIFTHLERP